MLERDLERVHLHDQVLPSFLSLLGAFAEPEWPTPAIVAAATHEVVPIAHGHSEVIQEHILNVAGVV